MRKRFRGGIHPNDSKLLTGWKLIETPPVPNRVIIPVRQHIGAPGIPLVKKNDLVKKGQVIASNDAFVSSIIHASISGKVIDVGNYPHPVFGRCLSIVIESDDQDEWIEGIPFKKNRDWESLSGPELLKIIREAGIVGMGGATFPTHVKLSPPKDKKIDTFVLNASECEPYLTSDQRSMIEYPQRIATGVKIVMKILDVTKGIVGIEENKPDSIHSMKNAFKETSIEVVPMHTKYPQGAEKMLIKTLTGREVRSGTLPMDVGVVVQNVSTVIAIADAVTKGIPLIERVVTVTGGAVKEPKNMLLRVGTMFIDAIAYCEGFKKLPEKVIMGGPMMGIAQYSLDVPVIKGVSGIVCLSKSEAQTWQEQNCINCGRCVEVCAMGLYPSMLGILGERGFYEEAKEKYSLFDCMECGSCVYICPARRRLVHYIKYAKLMNSAQAAKK